VKASSIVDPRVRKAAPVAAPPKAKPAPAPAPKVVAPPKGEQRKADITRQERNRLIKEAARKAGVWEERAELCESCAAKQIGYGTRRHRFMKKARAALVAGQSMDEAIAAAAADRAALCEERKPS
jgi:hypothetical protein